MAAMFPSALLLPLNSFFDLPTTRHKCAQLQLILGLELGGHGRSASKTHNVLSSCTNISNRSSLAGLCHLCLFLSYPFRLFLFHPYLFHPYLTIVDLISQDCWRGQKCQPIFRQLCQHYIFQGKASTCSIAENRQTAHGKVTKFHCQVVGSLHICSHSSETPFFPFPFPLSSFPFPFLPTTKALSASET